MSADTPLREAPKRTLQDMEVHDHWSSRFRTPENEPFFNAAFDQIALCFGEPAPTAVIDAGCGSGTKCMHLARRGYRVRGLDISQAILDEARTASKAAGLSDKITFAVDDLTRIGLPGGSQSHVLCWGVLMHVPAVQDAVRELSRIVAPGGILIVSEGNMRSVQARTLRWLKSILGREQARVAKTEAGIEFWEETSTGSLMTRQADIPWMIQEFESRGLQLVTRRAGQLTEIYTVIPWKPLRRLVHVINNVWFRAIRWAGPSFGNLLVFRKPPAH